MHPKFHRFLILLRAFVKDGLIKNWLTKSSFSALLSRFVVTSMSLRVTKLRQNRYCGEN